MHEIIVITSNGVAGDKTLAAELAAIQPKLHAVTPGVYLAEEDHAGRQAETSVRPLLQKLRASYLIGKCTAGLSNDHHWTNMFPKGSFRAGFPSAYDLYILVVTGLSIEIKSLLDQNGIPAKRILASVFLVSPPSDREAPDFAKRLSQTLNAHGVIYALARLYIYSSNSEGLMRAH